MVRHLVLFRLRRPVADGAAQRLLDALEAFAATAPEAERATVSAPLGLRGETPRTADAIIEVVFRDADAFHAYIASSQHVGLVQEVLEPSLEGWWAVQLD